MKGFLFATLLSFSMIISVHAQASSVEKSNEKAPIYLAHCLNYGSGVGYGYQSCVNNNFTTISRVLGGFFPSCTNFGTEVDYFYTSCINQNFRETQRKLGNAIYLSECMNFDRTTLDGFFVMCVNQNFNRVQYTIERL